MRSVTRRVPVVGFWGVVDAKETDVVAFDDRVNDLVEQPAQLAGWVTGAKSQQGIDLDQVRFVIGCSSIE